MKLTELKQLIREEISSVIKKRTLNEMAIKEMAKISGDLKAAIEKVIEDKPDLDGLALKKKIKDDADVDKALGADELYDNQLNRFISLNKGQRTLGQRGRKPNPDKAKDKKEA